MSFPSLPAEIYGHGKTVQISPCPGRFAPIGSAFPSAGDTVEDTRKNVEYVRQETKRWLASIAYLDDEVFRDRDHKSGFYCRMETYDFVLDCLRENAKIENLASINSTLRAFLQPLEECVGLVIRDKADHDFLMRHTYEALSTICYAILALGACEGVDPSKLGIIQASVNSAVLHVGLYESRIRSERIVWRYDHPFSWLGRRLRQDAKGTLLSISKSIVSPFTRVLRRLRKEDAHLNLVPQHLRQLALS